MGKRLIKLFAVFTIFSVFALFNTSLCGVCKAKEIDKNIYNSGIVDLEVATEDSTTETPVDEQSSAISNSADVDASDTDTDNNIESESSDKTNEGSKDITDGLVPKVDTTDFFQKIYDKLFTATNGVQKVVAVILIFLFIINIIMIGVALISKGKILWYIMSAFLIAVLFFCDIYAVEIITAINNWLAT